MSDADSTTRRYKRTTEFVATEVEDELVVLHTQSWNYFEFDNVAASIWTLLEEPQSLTSLVQALTAKFDVDGAQCLGDTKAFLDEMIAEGLVTTFE
jgi:hypothetical protein